MKHPRISIIITTKNEAHYLRACLDSVTSQIYKNIEIIVVDNHSSDKTKEIARRFTSRVFEAGPERSAQRNFGAKKAKGDYLLFLDADMILSPQVIGECVRGITPSVKSNIQALVIPEKSIGVGFWAKCKEMERSCYENVDWMEAARFYRKNIFRSLGGYDEKLIGPEDFELSQRVQWRYGKNAIGRIQSYILHDEGKLSLTELLKKKYYYGKQMRRYSTLPESQDYFKKQSNILARYMIYVRHPNILLSDPLGGMGMLLMKTLEMVALACGGCMRIFTQV